MSSRVLYWKRDPGAATRRLWFWSSVHYMKAWRHPQNRKYTVNNVSHFQQKRTETRAHLTLKKISWNLGRANRHTDRHTDTLIAILCLSTKSEIIRGNIVYQISKAVQLPGFRPGPLIRSLIFKNLDPPVV